MNHFDHKSFVVINNIKNDSLKSFSKEMKIFIFHSQDSKFVDRSQLFIKIVEDFSQSLEHFVAKSNKTEKIFAHAKI